MIIFLKNTTLTTLSTEMDNQFESTKTYIDEKITEHLYGSRSRSIKEWRIYPRRIKTTSRLNHWHTLCNLLMINLWSTYSTYDLLMQNHVHLYDLWFTYDVLMIYLWLTFDLLIFYLYFTYDLLIQPVAYLCKSWLMIYLWFTYGQVKHAFTKVTYDLLIIY